MKFYINQIPEEGQHIQTDYNPIEMDMARTDIKSIDKMSLSGWVTKCSTELIVKASITCAIKFICARCLDPFLYTISKDISCIRNILEEAVIDITDDVRQEILLEYPISCLCRTDCKGLCNVCGRNLNEDGQHKCV